MARFNRLEKEQLSVNLNSMGKRSRVVVCDEEDQEDDDKEEVEVDDDDDGECTDSETDNGERPSKRFLLEVIGDLSTNYDRQVERYHVMYQEVALTKDAAETSPQHFVTLKPATLVFALQKMLGFMT